MDDIINLATFQFDTAKLETSLNTLQDKMFALKKEQEGYANQTKATKQAILELSKQQLQLAAAGKENSDQFKENVKTLEQLNEVEKQLYKNQQNTATSMSRVGQEITKTNTQLKAYMDSESKQTTLFDAGNKALQTQITNINTARASNTELLRVRNQLNPTIATEAKLITELNTKLDSNNAFIKENASQYEKQKINIGNYTESIKDAIGQSGLFGGKLQNVTQIFNSFAPVFNTLNQDIKNTFNQLNIFGNTAEQTGEQTQGAAEGTKALTFSQKALAGGFNIATGAARIFTLALAATGIGLIIGSVVLLIGYLKTFDPVVDAIEQGMAALGAAVRVVQQALAGLLSGDFSALDGLTGKIKEAAVAAAQLKAAQQELADQQAIQSVNNKKQEGEINRLILQSKDRSKTEQERIDLLNKAEKINRDNFETNRKLSERELQNAIESARIKGQLNEEEIASLRKRGIEYAYVLLNNGKITQDEVDAIAKAEEAKIEIYNRSTSEQEKIINRRNTQIEKQEAEDKAAAERDKKLQEEAIERAKKLAEAQIQAMQTELDFYLESQGERKKSMAEQLAIDREVMRQSLEITKAEYEAKKITKREYELANLEITNEFAQKQIDATIANASIEFELFKLNNQRKLDANKLFSDELYKQELDRLNKQAEAEAAQQTLLFAQGKLNAQEYGLAIAQIDKNQQDANETARLEREQAIKDKKSADIVLQDELNSERFDYDLALQNERLNQQYALDKEAAIKNGTDLALLDEAYAKRRKDIEFAVQQNKLQLASNTLDNLINILGKESQVGKALAIAQTTIDTYQSATAAYKALAGIPVVGPALGAIAAGAAVASGLANVKKITAVKEPKIQKSPGYARGVIGLTGQGTGTSDSISANLSAGESVLTAEATRRFPNLLSTVNQIGGGVGANGMTASENSLLQNDLISGANNSQMVQAIAEAVALGAELGTKKGSQDGIRDLSSERQIMSDAKF